MSEHEWALVTGASGGIGAELAGLLAKDGYNLLLAARSKDKLEKMQSDFIARYGVQVRIIAIDLSQKDAAKELWLQTEEINDQIAVLINNAGFGDFGTFAQCEWDKQAKMLQLNVVTLMQLTHYFLPMMINKGRGRILNIGSIASFEPGPLMATYFATKAAVLSFTEAISRETRDTGVTATVLCPGPTSTGFESRADLEKSNMFKSLKVADAHDVAKYGYRKLMRGKTVAIHGWTNKLMIFALRFVPRSFVTRMVGYTIRER